jgi:hemerythrin-like domain-containing protein
MDIYESLKNDHQEVISQLKELITLEADDDYRFALVTQIRDSLIPHSRAEESILYNTMRAVGGGKSLIMHGYKEHLEAETLLRTLQVMDKMNLGWKPIAEKLLAALEHHIQEEETDIFNEAKKLFTDAEALSLGEAFETLKPQIKTESFLGTTVDMVKNMMPPKFVDSYRHTNPEHH